MVNFLFQDPAKRKKSIQQVENTSVGEASTQLPGTILSLLTEWQQLCDED